MKTQGDTNRPHSVKAEFAPDFCATPPGGAVLVERTLMLGFLVAAQRLTEGNLDKGGEMPALLEKAHKTVRAASPSFHLTHFAISDRLLHCNCPLPSVTHATRFHPSAKRLAPK